MYLDANTKVASAQAFATGNLSASSIDLGNSTPKREVGTGESLVLLAQVTVAAAGATSISVVQSDNADLSSGDVLITRPLTTAQLVANTLWQVPIPEGSVTKRYLGCNFVGTSVTMNAWIIPDEMVPQVTIYAKGYVIS